MTGLEAGRTQEATPASVAAVGTAAVRRPAAGTAAADRTAAGRPAAGRPAAGRALAATPCETFGAAGPDQTLRYSLHPAPSDRALVEFRTPGAGADPYRLSP